MSKRTDNFAKLRDEFMKEGVDVHLEGITALMIEYGFTATDQYKDFIRNYVHDVVLDVLEYEIDVVKNKELSKKLEELEQR